MNSASLSVLVIVGALTGLATAGLRCPAMEEAECESRGGHLTYAACSRTVYVRAYCPYMCGICEESQRPTCADDPYCNESEQHCFWTGPRASAHYCASRQDNGICSSRGGGWGCESCWNQQLVRYLCPHMCGYC